MDETDPAETVSRTRFIGIDYPALQVEPPRIQPPGDMPSDHASTFAVNAVIAMNHVMQYDESYRAGARAVVDFIEADQRRGCDTQYMTVSYSQGVIAARLAMGLLDNDTDRIVGSYVIGDPFQKAGGASSDRHRSIANTSPHTQGVGPLALDLMSGSAELVHPVFRRLADATVLKGPRAYVEEITAADPVVYRDDGPGETASRALCHQHDPTCGISSLTSIDVMQHTNYFAEASPEGAVDLEHEVAEFDAQVKALADSAASSPRERVLTKTPSLVGRPTVYNVAGARPDDSCAWDADSDGSVEAVLPCGSYEALHQSAPRMTVTVTDSFGSEHVLVSESEAIDPEPLQEAIDEALGLDPDSWYQLEAYRTQDGTQKSCVGVGQYVNSPIAAMPILIGTECRDLDADPSPKSAAQAFRLAAATGTSSEPRRILLWGYDDRYSWRTNVTDAMSLQGVSADKAQPVEASFVTMVDDVPYYRIRFEANYFGKEACMRLGRSGALVSTACDPDDLGQLFSAKASTSSFGDLSIERDATPPDPPSNLRITKGSLYSQLKWDVSADGWRTAAKYRVYRSSAQAPGEVLVGTPSIGVQSIENSRLDPGVEYSYRVVAIDYAGNESESSSISYTRP